MRIIFAGSSDRSRSSVMFAAKMSLVRENIPISNSAIVIRPVTPKYYTRIVPLSRKRLEIAENR